MEADLAFRGIDLRDLYRRGSGLTLRRLQVLIKGLPYDASFWAALEAEKQAEQKPAADKIRERAEFYRKKAEEAQ